MRRLAVIMAACVAAGSTAGCSHQSDQRGELVVLVTLSRGSGVGPTFQHVPQADEAVRIVAKDGTRRTAFTDSRGRATVRLAPGDYGVTADFCPTGPVSVNVHVDSTSRAVVDCVAP